MNPNSNNNSNKKEDFIEFINQIESITGNKPNEMEIEEA